MTVWPNIIPSQAAATKLNHAKQSCWKTFIASLKKVIYVFILLRNSIENPMNGRPTHIESLSKLHVVKETTWIIQVTAYIFNAQVYDISTSKSFHDLYMGHKVFKNGQVKFFKVCLPQILLGSFLNTLSHISDLCSYKSNFTRSRRFRMAKKRRWLQTIYEWQCKKMLNLFVSLFATIYFSECWI